ncbi:transcription factor atf21 [Fusarium longipes]|uniref:Transcription factor atf21 n=1 Tax=Fusarium longipes TaxID=694270 RepID=A0A395TAR8_9HYPO|nr:transcription factor atf21 [Fusarium longipes]
MDRSTQNFDQNHEFRDSYTLNGSQEDAIDPLLNDCSPHGTLHPNVSNSMDNQLFMSSSMWNPTLSNPVDYYPPGMAGMAPTTLTNPLQPNSPIQPVDTRSSPRTPSSEPVFAASRTSSKSSVPSFNSADADTKPRRSSRTTKAQHQQPSTETATKPLRRRRASKAVSVKTDLGDEDEDDDDDDGLDETAKRSKFLKRNRIAASKCRQKKKEWVSSLEDTRYGLEHENNILHKQYNGLVDELSTIKNQLMQHASCNDANINQWLDNEARKFVQRIAAQSKTQIPPQQNTGDCCDDHRRSISVATSIPQSIESEANDDHMSISMIKSGP